MVLRSTKKIKVKGVGQECPTHSGTKQISRRELTEPEHDLAEILPLQQQVVSFRSFFQRKHVPDHGPQVPLRRPCGELLPGLIHQLALRRQIGQPQTVHARTFGIKDARVQAARVARSVAPYTMTRPKSRRQRTLFAVCSPPSTEDCIHAFAVGQVLNRFCVIAPLVIDPGAAGRAPSPAPTFLPRKKFRTSRCRAVFRSVLQRSPLHRPRRG